MSFNTIICASGTLGAVLSRFCRNALEHSTPVVIVYAELFEIDFRMNIFYDISFLKDFKNLIISVLSI